MKSAAPTAGKSTTVPGKASGTGSLGRSKLAAYLAAETNTRAVPHASLQKGRGAGGKDKRGRMRPPGPGFKNDLAILKAEGMTKRGIAQTLDVSESTVLKVQALPDVQERIAELRKIWSGEAQKQMTELAPQAWEMTREFVGQRDSKGFDNSIRGLVGMERISASVSGQSQRVDVTGVPPAVDIKALILALTGSAE